jgi:hypothetical protein
MQIEDCSGYEPSLTQGGRAVAEYSEAIVGIDVAKLRRGDRGSWA